MKLAAPAAPAPAEPISEPADDAGFGDFGGDEEPTAEPKDDKPFDDEPFDAGVDANEEEDPKKFIEQLTGKLGQSLRKYTETQGGPDFDLEKFAINSLLSATHTAEMDEEDKKDIIKKVNTAGNNDSEDSDMGDDNNDSNSGDDNDNGGGGASDIDAGFGGEEGEDDLDEIRVFENENLFLDEPKKNNMFQPGSNDGLNESNKSLDNSKKSSTFDKNYLKNKLNETFNQEDMNNAEPQTAPAPVKTPVVKPGETKPSRKNKPFLPMPSVQPDPKALSEGKFDYQIYHNTFASAVQTASEYATKLGYTINDDEWFTKIATGPKKPSEGETNRYSLSLYKDGKEQRKMLQIQVYGMRNKYELNAYIN